METYKNLSLENMEGEIWKQFHEGKYRNFFVSNRGRIKSVDKTTGVEIIKDQVLKNQKTNAGKDHYRLYVQLHSEGAFTRGVSRIVAQAFIPNPNNLPFVCHKDDNPLNNTVENLFWGTAKVNNKQAHDIPTIVLTRNAEIEGQFDSIKEAVESINYTTSTLKTAKSVGKYVIMKKDFYDQLNHDELLHICQNVDSTGKVSV